MMNDGVGGTTTDEGLAGLLATAAVVSGTEGDGYSAQLYYEVFGAYDNGQFDRVNLNYRFSRSTCHTMDFANRLTGWITATNQCSV